MRNSSDLPHYLGNQNMKLLLPAGYGVKRVSSTKDFPSTAMLFETIFPHRLTVQCF